MSVGWFVPRVHKPVHHWHRFLLFLPPVAPRSKLILLVALPSRRTLLVFCSRCAVHVLRALGERGAQDERTRSAGSKDTDGFVASS